MKKICNLLLLLLLIALAACTRFSNRGTVDRPFITSADGSSFSVERVILTDSSTVLDAVVNYRPGWWFQISDSSRIVAGGEEYLMTAIDGIEADKHVTMPDSGIVHFSMTFPAVPADVKTIDFNEGFAGGYALRGIDLTGTLDNTVNLSKIPAEARVEFVDGKLPEPVLKYDSTTVNVHFVGYTPDMGEIGYLLQTLRGYEASDKPVNPDSDGNVQLKFALSGPAMLTIRGNQSFPLSGKAHLSPGESVDMYVDTHLSGILNMATRDGLGEQVPDDFIASYHNGYYANFDRADLSAANDYDFGLNGKEPIYRKSGDEYTEFFINKYHALCDSVDASGLSEMAKEYAKAELQVALAYAASGVKDVARYSYISFNEAWGKPFPADSIKTVLSPANARSFAELIDFNSPAIYLSSMATDASNTDIWRQIGVNAPVYEGLRAYIEAYSKADKGELTELPADLKSAPEGFADDVEAHNKYSVDKLASLDWSKVTPTPDVPANKIIEKIAEPYRGKVVMIDLWNTWCGPCRAALAANEPEKSGDLSSDDIVWIYVADESSPAVRYLDMINDIKGVHYRLTKDQITAIRSQFDVDGIPYYILVDKTGKATGRPDLRDHAKFKRTILEQLAK